MAPASSAANRSSTAVRPAHRNVPACPVNIPAARDLNTPRAVHLVELLLVVLRLPAAGRALALAPVSAVLAPALAVRVLGPAVRRLPLRPPARNAPPQAARVADSSNIRR